MRNKKWIAALCCGAIILSPISPGTNPQAVGEAKNDKEYIIQTEDDMTLEVITQTYEDEIETEKQEATLLEDQNALVMNLTAEQAKDLDKKDGVTVERNITLSGESAENPDMEDVKRLAKDQWNRAAVKAEHVKKAYGKRKINVAILDSGIDILSDVKFASQTSLIPEESTDDRTGHGTIISNLIARNENGFCQTGILPEDAAVNLYNVRILDENNQTPLSRVIEGIQWCIASQMDVINMSFGTETESEILHEAIRKAEEAGILMVSSVGNSGEKGGGITEYPAGYDEVIGVGSVNEKMERSAFSNTGKSVELAAPGENIPVTSYWGLQGSGSGTSYAAAHVTAIAAKLWSENPDRSAQEIRVLLDRSATDMGDEEKYGHGLVNYEYASQHEELVDLGKDAELAEDDKENKEKEGNALSGSEILESEHDISQENKNSEDTARGYEIPASLKASWNSEGHTNLISSLASGLMNTANINAVKDAATYVDKSSTLKKYDILHARAETNYISAAKRLYEAARDWNEKKDYSILYEEAERYSSADENESLRYKNVQELKTAMREAVSYKFQESSQKSISVNRGKLQLLGLAIHVAGDAYAHKTMCDSSQEGLKEIEDIFDSIIILSGQSTFKTGVTYSKIKAAVTSENGLTTAALGKDFFAVENKGNIYYVDSTSFMAKRYSVATKVATSYLLKDYCNDKNFSPLVFCPYEIKAGSDYRNNYKYKLRHFKAYLTGAGFSPLSFVNGKNSYSINDIYALSFDK